MVQGFWHQHGVLFGLAQVTKIKSRPFAPAGF